HFLKFFKQQNAHATKHPPLPLNTELLIRLLCSKTRFARSTGSQARTQGSGVGSRRHRARSAPPRHPPREGCKRGEEPGGQGRNGASQPVVQICIMEIMKIPGNKPVQRGMF
uniref:Uncharacterized protein n=1 Tax=Oryzias latipes TaxID=8090 RepID=A0A3P9KGZ7_ORYLA